MGRFLFAIIAVLAAGSAPAHAQDAAELLVRLTRLEQTIRQMSGQIEQLQFQNRKLDDELTRFRKDTDMRFEDAGKAPSAPRSGAGPASTGATGAPATSPLAPPRAPQPPIQAGSRRGDAFDPAANPNAPGAPRAIGTTAPSAPLAPAAPRIGPSGIEAAPEDDDQPPQRRAGVGQPLDLANPPQEQGPLRVAPSAAVSSPGNTRAEFDAAVGLVQRGEYAAAEMGLRQFLQSHPRSALAADATYWLGESYSMRNLHRDAAEQFLKVSTSWPQTGRAADSMLKLGMALAALGAHDQACSTFREIDRKYPNASPTVKRGVEREFRRARCAA
ncbi:MAG: tol-pal system protein YbgF [Beijerinckiaceae bacterium]